MPLTCGATRTSRQVARQVPRHGPAGPVEPCHAPRPISGAALGIRPTALAALDELGVGEALRAAR
ncbi:hypothetical protein [Promicromonospora sp. NPDC050249]|uniref:hypothetical protein n=1 Tax=Promicromonospora sp. NPDC050249 TaxID=3154743 RepID=UPI0033EC43C7